MSEPKRGEPKSTVNLYGRVALAVLGRPRLWPVAVGQALRLARPGWWRRWPPVPRPDRHYLDFRLRTAYGRSDQPFPPDDVIEYLEWCREHRKLAQRPR